MKKFMKCSFSGLLLGIVLFFPGSCKKDPLPPPPFPTIEFDGKLWSAVNVVVDVPCTINYPNAADTQRYGPLCTYDCALQAVEALGEGWRIPTIQEWNDLFMYYGGFCYWPEDYCDGNDPAAAYNSLLENGSSGMDLLLGGTSLTYIGTYGGYWSSTNVGGDGIAYVLMHGGYLRGMRSIATANSTTYLSLRVVRDL